MNKGDTFYASWLVESGYEHNLEYMPYITPSGYRPGYENKCQRCVFRYGIERTEFMFIGWSKLWIGWRQEGYRPSHFSDDEGQSPAFYPERAVRVAMAVRARGAGYEKPVRVLVEDMNDR